MFIPLALSSSIRYCLWMGSVFLLNGRSKFIAYVRHKQQAMAVARLFTVLHLLPGLLQSVVWSLGVLAYQLLLQRLPFKGSTAYEIQGSMLSRTKGGVGLPLWMSDDAINFIRGALKLVSVTAQIMCVVPPR